MHNIKYFFAERKFNNYFEEIKIEGFNENNNLYFTSIITRLNSLDELVKDDDHLIIVKSGEWFYKINTIRYKNKCNITKSVIKFDFKKYNISPHVYICFIGTIIV